MSGLLDLSAPLPGGGARPLSDYRGKVAVGN